MKCMQLAALTCRLPLQTDPCNAVGSGEAQAHEEVLPVSERAVHATRPPGFENAARQEHVNEAAALRSMQQGVRPCFLTGSPIS